MKKLANLILILLIAFGCTFVSEDVPVVNDDLAFGSDFSIMKKMEEYGGEYKMDGIVTNGFYIFKKNGFTWARLRIFHSPDMKGAVCNDLNYTLDLAKKAKSYGYKILLNFHYSDTWADPGHQTLPKAWENLSFSAVNDSVYRYTRKVIERLAHEGALPDMVQIGNEINNGMLWPHGKLWYEGGTANWGNLSSLLKSGIRGVKDAQTGGGSISIMIHAATGGSLTASRRFYNNIIDNGVDFDVIGLSYYPWWHGSFDKLEENLYALSISYNQQISIVETAYYSNGWYPEAGEYVIHDRPFPPNEKGQYNFMLQLAKTVKKYPRVSSIFYWKPDELNIPESKVPYLGRSLFDDQGNARMGISAWSE